MTAKEIIRVVAPEFNNIEDSTLDKWVEIVKPMVSKKMFGKLYEQALAYLICHKLKMAGYGVNPLGDGFSVGAGFNIASVSEGGSSINFGTGQASQNIVDDAELGMTSYGVQFRQIRISVIAPIHCSGETI